jgi:hypothetical protein
LAILRALRASCAGLADSVGLRDDDDTHAVIVCRAHYGRLRRIPTRDLDRIEQVLLEAYMPSRIAAVAQ